MRVAVTVILIVAGLAGCAEGPGIDAMPEIPDVQAFAGITQERPVVAAVTIRETPEPGTVAAWGSERWDPRDAEFTYHGLAQVHDEWGRLVAAHVFAYNPMVYTITEFEIDPMTGQLQIEGEYQERNWEMFFDAADGRMMGLTDLDRGVRSFSGPDFRLPFGPGYIGDMLLSMVEYMHGDITAPVVWDWGDSNRTYWMEPYTGKRPLPGDCDMFLQRAKSPGDSLPAKPEPDPYLSIACFDDSMIPLWHWSGNETRGHLALERSGPGISWPGPMGDVLPSEPFDAAPMEPIDAVLPTDPIYVPPAGSGGDWAAMVRDRVAALHYSIPYQEFQATRGPTYAHHVITGWPPHGFAVPLLGGINSVANYDETTWVMVTEKDWFWTSVHTMESGEGGRHFVPDASGATFANSRYPSREDVGDVVMTESVRGRVPELSPQDPRQVNWMVWPDFGSDWVPRAWWAIGSHCFEEAPDAHFLMFDGTDGHLLGAGGMVSHQNGCSMGSFSSWMGGQMVTVFPPTPDRPFPVVFDAHGELALPLPVSELLGPLV